MTVCEYVSAYARRGSNWADPTFFFAQRLPPRNERAQYVDIIEHEMVENAPQDTV